MAGIYGMFATVISFTLLIGAVCVPRRPEVRLYRYLMKGYDPSTRPILNGAQPVRINFSVTLNQIMDLVEKNQTLISRLWIHEQWYDELLKWNPDDFDGLKEAKLPSSEIWVPDVFIFNNADKGKQGFVHLNQTKVTVSSSGLIDWTVPLIVKSSCGVEVTYFPFDVQKCFLKFGSWIYDSTQLDLNLGSPEVDLTTFISHNELELTKATIHRTNVTNRRLHFHQIVMDLYLRRRPLYYLYTIVSPILVLCILTLFSHFLPCDHGGKVGIGLAVFLSLYVLQLAVAENIPESNAMPIISIFIIMVMTLNATSLLIATAIINIKLRGDQSPIPKVPRSLLFFFQCFIAKITCTSMAPDDQSAHVSCEYIADEEETDMSKVMEAAQTSTTLCDDSPFFRKRHLSDSSTDDTIDLGSPCRRAHVYDPIQDVKFYQSSDSDSMGRTVSQLSLNRPAPQLNRKKILKELKREWYFLAECIDRLVFAFYLMGLTLIVTFLLIVIPGIQGQ